LFGGGRCAMRSFVRLVPIGLNVVTIWFAEVNRKNLSELDAQCCNSVDVGSPPVLTWNVQMVMPAGLMLAQAPLPIESYMRLSTCVLALEPLLYPRCRVFRPSDSRMMM
jgi:hypothetical protein